MTSELKTLPQITNLTWDLNDFLGKKGLFQAWWNHPRIFGEKAFHKWIESLRNNSRTVFSKKRFSLYIATLHRFCRFVHKSPSQLVDLAFDWNLTDPRKRGSNPIVSMLRSYRDQKYKVVANNQNAVNSEICVLKSFFKHNEVTMKLNGSTNGMPANKIANQMKEIVEKHLAALRDVKARALKIFTCQSGASIGDLLGLQEEGIWKKAPLTYGQIKDILKENKPALIEMKRNKNNTPYFLPITPEIIKVVNEMLRAELKKDDDDPLFINTKTKTPYSVFSFDKISARAAKALHLKSRDINAQANRRYFNSQLTKAGAPHWFIEALMGHKQKGTDGNYNTLMHDKDEMLELWKKYYRAVELNPEPELPPPELEQQVDELNQKLNEKDTQIAELQTIIQQQQKQQQDQQQQLQAQINTLTKANTAIWQYIRAWDDHLPPEPSEEAVESAEKTRVWEDAVYIYSDKEAERARRRRKKHLKPK